MSFKREIFFCISGYGKLADWYKNLLAAKEVKTILPGESVYGVVEDVSDQNERIKIIRKTLQNAGFAG
jgi:hypothetical protein